MFTKFNRVLLASGLVLTSLVGFGSAAFAESGSGNVVVTGTPTGIASITLTGSTNSFPLVYDEAYEAPIATVSYYTNVIGDWEIKAQGNNPGAPGELIHTGTDGITATIPYKVSLSGTDSTGFQDPVASDGLAGATALLTGKVEATDPVGTDVTGATLTIKIAADDTKVPTMPTTGSAYTETLTLVFTSGL